MDLLEGPNEDSARSLSRVKVLVGAYHLFIFLIYAHEAKKDGKEGWVTVKGHSASEKTLENTNLEGQTSIQKASFGGSLPSILVQLLASQEIRALLTPKSRRGDLGSKEVMRITLKALFAQWHEIELALKGRLRSCFIVLSMDSNRLFIDFWSISMVFLRHYVCTQSVLLESKFASAALAEVGFVAVRQGSPEVRRIEEGEAFEA